MRATLAFRSDGRSVLSRARRANLDAFHAGTRLLAVASGLGGHHPAGAEASSLVVAALAPLEHERARNPVRALRAGTEAATAAIRRRGEADPDAAGLATSLSAVLLTGARVGLAHVGDTRIYLLRDRTFRQLTHDDTTVQLLIEQGRISEEEAQLHPLRPVLRRALDGRDPQLSLTPFDARPGDRYLLCSDGLSGTLSDETLADALRTSPDPRACVEQLVERARRGDAPDNVTCVVADVAEP